MKLRVDFNQNPNIKRFLSHLERQINLSISKDDTFDIDCVFPNYLINYQLDPKSNFKCSLYKYNKGHLEHFCPNDSSSFTEIPIFSELFEDGNECYLEGISAQDTIDKITFINKIFGKISKLLAFC